MIPKIIRDLTSKRKALGVSRAKVSKIAGVSATHIYRIEKGDTKGPRINTVENIRAALAEIEAERGKELARSGAKA